MLHRPTVSTAARRQVLERLQLEAQLAHERVARQTALEQRQAGLVVLELRGAGPRRRRRRAPSAARASWRPCRRRRSPPRPLGGLDRRAQRRLALAVRPLALGLGDRADERRRSRSPKCPRSSLDASRACPRRCRAAPRRPRPRRGQPRPRSRCATSSGCRMNGARSASRSWPPWRAAANSSARRVSGRSSTKLGKRTVRAFIPSAPRALLERDALEDVGDPLAGVD